MSSTMENSSHQNQDSGYAYQHPSRLQTQSTSSIPSSGRGPSSAGAAYGSHCVDIARYSYLGSMTIRGDAKQRRRRGNMSKETTDKLRFWIVAHLQHPYPTEEEKRELVGLTGLQIRMFSLHYTQNT